MVAVQKSVSSALGQFGATALWEDFPATVQQATRRSLLNGLATALGSARDPVVAL